METNKQNFGMVVGSITFGHEIDQFLKPNNNPPFQIRLLEETTTVQEIQRVLEDIEAIIWKNEEAFLKKFVQCCVNDTSELITVSFNSCVCTFVWMTHEGQHISDSFELSVLEQWIHEVKESK